MGADTVKVTMHKAMKYRIKDCGNAHEESPMRTFLMSNCGCSRKVYNLLVDWGRAAKVLISFLMWEPERKRETFFRARLRSRRRDMHPDLPGVLLWRGRGTVVFEERGKILWPVLMIWLPVTEEIPVPVMP